MSGATFMLVGDELVSVVGGTRNTLDPATWPKFRKTALASATRISGPFTAETSEGPLTCSDGYLAVDARGYPYPIAAAEFELIYERASDLAEPPTWLDRVGALVELHPATAAVLRYFAFEHLPPELQEVSRPFGELALDVALRAQGAEATVAIRKLLEAKDCAVRDVLPPAPAYPLVARDGS